jgi:penicillin-binding protein 2
MGYAPFDKPEIAFAVFVENGGHGGSAAGPVARAVVDFWADKMNARRSEVSAVTP